MRLVPGDPRSLGGYWLAGRLGAGGRGVVYDAYDDEGRRFAVKVPRGEVTQQLTDAVWRVQPGHLARVVDVGVDGAVPYIVSEFVDGPDLRRAVRRHGPYDGDELCALAAATATALRTLHGVGIAHRDLRPESVLLSAGGPTLIELGVSAPGSVGARTYMAPEVFTGERPGPAADVFAWGAVLLFAATGRDPFQGGSLGEIMHRLLAVDPDLDALPDRLRDPVGRALAKSPQDRPSAAGLLAALPEAEPRLAPPDGLSGPASLGELAESVYASLPADQREEAPALLLRLLNGRPGHEAPGDDHGDDGGGIVARLTEAGLLVRRSVAVTPATSEVGTLVAVSGERFAPAGAALVRAWPRLRAWAAEHGSEHRAEQDVTQRTAQPAEEDSAPRARHEASPPGEPRPRWVATARACASRLLAVIDRHRTGESRQCAPAQEEKVPRR
jgi:hypothetical protein